MPTKSESKKLSATKKSASPESASAKVAVSARKNVGVRQPAARKSTSNALSKKKSAVASPQPRLVMEVLQPTVEMISARAHQIWLSEGCPEGRAEEHWLRAEAELRNDA